MYRREPDWSILGFPGGKHELRRDRISCRGTAGCDDGRRVDCGWRRPRSRTIAAPTAPQFIVGFFQYDKRAHLQIDGKAVTLQKRVALSGSRYSGGGVTLTITKTGTTLKHGKRPVTACELT